MCVSVLVGLPYKVAFPLELFVYCRPELCKSRRTCSRTGWSVNLLWGKSNTSGTRRDISSRPMSVNPFAIPRFAVDQSVEVITQATSCEVEPPYLGVQTLRYIVQMIEVDVEVIKYILWGVKSRLS